MKYSKCAKDVGVGVGPETIRFQIGNNAAISPHFHIRNKPLPIRKRTIFPLSCPILATLAALQSTAPQHATHITEPYQCLTSARPTPLPATSTTCRDISSTISKPIQPRQSRLRGCSLASRHICTPAAAKLFSVFSSAPIADITNRR